MKKKLKVGDQVNVIDESITGKVIRLNSFRVTIEDEFGFELEYPIHKLVISQSLNINEISPIDKHIEIIEKIRDERFEIVDLHIEALKIRHEQLSMPKIEFQINAFHEAIQEAKKNNLDALIVIHGKGSGVLKEALIREIKKYSNFSCLPIEDGNMKNAALKIKFNNLKN